MADVFVSYVSEDRTIAEKISRGLEGAGFSVWWDRHIHGGVGFRKEIDRQLTEARVVIVLWSAASLDSEWVCDEAQQARDQKKLIPLRLESVQPPLGFRQTQSLDFGVWNGDLKAASFIKLVDSARHLLGAVAAQALVPTFDKTVLRHANASSAKSVAVLPFTDMSEKKDQEYFADGMAEEIINLLAKVPDLLVPARTSSFYFKGKPTKVADIGRQLGVTHILDGSVRRSGDRLRVTTQLVRADNGYHLWSETYDREMHDVFAMQDDIANAVVQALQIKLMGGELSRQRGGTQNLEAYQLYLRARSARVQNSRSSLDAAREYLEQAIKLDPSYGIAWSELANSVLYLASDCLMDPTEGFESARHLAQRALQLSPGLADAHASLAIALMALERDWAGAETQSQQALAIDPTNTAALLGAGNLARTLGRWDDAEQHLHLALARNPLSPDVILSLAIVYHLAGRFADAEGLLRQLLELAPGFVGARQLLARTLLALGKPEVALAVVQQEADQEMRLWMLPTVLQASGRQDEANETLRALIAQWADRAAYTIAMNHAYRGDRDLAVQWLERAYKQMDPDLLGIVGEPMFASMSDAPRYKAFLRKMNLIE